jgi:hypothetical protein
MGNQISEEAVANYWEVVAGCKFPPVSDLPLHRALDLGGKTRLHFIGLDSMRTQAESGHTGFWVADGEIGEPQLRNLSALLASIQSPDQDGTTHRTVVYLHHDPTNRDYVMKLTDKDAFWEVVRNKIDILLFGHTGGLGEYQQEEKEYGIGRILQSNEFACGKGPVQLGTLWGPLLDLLPLPDEVKKIMRRQRVMIDGYRCCGVYVRTAEQLPPMPYRPTVYKMFFPQSLGYPEDRTRQLSAWERCQLLARPNFDHMRVEDLATLVLETSGRSVGVPLPPADNAEPSLAGIEPAWLTNEFPLYPMDA